MKRELLLTMVLTLILLGCTPYYLTDNFEAKTAEHETIAVLPFEMHYTGLLPEGMTDRDLRDIEVAESQAFQISFHREILRSTHSKKRPIRVGFQDYGKTLQTLKEHNIDIKDSWSMNAEDLAPLLGVDAVVRGRIVKNRLMSDFASYGIDVGVHILSGLANHAIWPFLPPDITKSKEIAADYLLLDGKDDKVLWSVSFRVDADWTRRANDIIDDISRRGARTFPYRTDQQFQQQLSSFE